MVLLRAARKVLRTLPELAPENVASDTELGDWYVNRKSLLLLVSAASLLAVLTPARRVSTLPDCVANLVAERLESMHLQPRIIAAEVQAMDSVYVGRTNDRSVTGNRVGFAKTIPCYLPVNGWDKAIRRHPARLCHTSTATTEPFHRRAPVLVRPAR